MLPETTIKIIYENYKDTAVRIGKYIINRGKNLPKIEVEFPCCMLSTQAGMVPNLTHETMNYIPGEITPQMVQFPVKSVVNHQDVFEQFPDSIEEFFGLSNSSLTYLTTHDFTIKSKSGYNTKKAIAIWGSKGKVAVSTEKHLSLIKSMKPTLFEILADNDTMENASVKRTQKSMAFSEESLKYSIQFYKETLELQNSIPVICLEGGDNLKTRKEYIARVLSAIKEENFDKYIGFVFDALAPSQDSVELINETSKDLPQEKIRIIHGEALPRSILQLIESGCDVFDTTLPCKLSEDGKAFTFPLPELNVGESDELDLKDDKNKESFVPIINGCECYTCQRHTRAYIHHLFATREMLGPLLLTLHNLQHYLMFFHNLRNSLKNNTYENFRKLYFK